MEFHKLQEADRDTFLEMAREFYHSDAVLKPVPDSYFENTLKECLRSDEYLLCYILEWGENAAGYALLSKSYSPEAGTTLALPYTLEGDTAYESTGPVVYPVATLALSVNIAADDWNAAVVGEYQDTLTFTATIQ